MHGSGGFASVLTNGTVFTGNLVAAEIWTAASGAVINTPFKWSASNGGVTSTYLGGPTVPVYKIFPRDMIDGMPNDRNIVNTTGYGETYWVGTANWNGRAFDLHTERKVDAMMTWLKANTPVASQTRWYATGDSMGGWGGGTYSMRRPQFFGAVFLQTPRWRYHGTQAALQVHLNDFQQAFPPKVYAYESAPSLPTGVRIVDHVNCIAYASNPANPMTWVGWTIGRLDDFVLFSEHVAMITAMRAGGRGFAVAWNNGGHGSQPNIDSYIKNSYPPGLFEVGKGYPVFTNHSLDNDPAVDLIGGINLGLSFKDVVETASGWSCLVTNINAACTVTVRPKSTIFTASVTPVTVTIPSAATWVPVSFTA